MTGRILLVMVPGAYFQPGDFAANGIVAALERQASPIDAVEAALPAQHYLDGDAAAWLLDQVIAPARAEGRRIWLLGISLGGLGALLAAQTAPDAIEGLVLLAPFLGSRGLVAEIAAEGGLATWSPGPIAPGDIERRMMAGLKQAMPRRLHVAWGESDRFAPAGRLLAQSLPPGRAIALPGGHDWPTWTRLWSAVLATAPFDAAGIAG